MIVYRIVNWSDNFENNRTREMKRMAWVPMPVKQDGDGYTELLDHPNGAAHFGAWCSIVELAAKCEPRGTLLRDACGAHTATSMARITRIKEDVYDEVLPRLVSIGWLETYDIPQEGASKPQVPAPRARARNGTERNGTERNGTEQKDTDLSASKPPTCPACPKGEIIGAWNGMAEKAGLPKLQDLNATRQKHLKARWTSPYWRDNWRKALDAVPSKPFLMGQTGGAWRANFDWFLTEKAVPKVLEGGFDGQGKAGREPPVLRHNDVKGRCAKCGSLLVNEVGVNGMHKACWEKSQAAEAAGGKHG